MVPLLSKREDAPNQDQRSNGHRHFQEWEFALVGPSLMSGFAKLQKDWYKT